MASAKWLHQRLWCGRLPLFHLLTDGELLAERNVSMLYFGSNEFAELRTQLLTKYLPYLLALQRFLDSDHHLHQQQQQQQDHNDEHCRVIMESFTVFPPLFYGFNSINLSSDRLVGREQRIQVTLVVDLVLTLFVMAQMHALYAEAQVEQAVRLQNDGLLQIAERSWQDALKLFTRASFIAKNARSQLSQSNDALLGSVLRFFHGIDVKAQVLGHMCAIHRISTRVYFLILADESTERLGRVVSTYARCAHTLIRAAAKGLEDLPENEFTRQLLWLLKTYETRWRTIHYSCEQTVFQLDFNPDIAIHFSDAILRLKLAPLPSYSHRHDAFFTRIAQELQLVHQGHLNDAMDEKKALLTACHQKFGNSWSTEDTSKAEEDELLLSIRELTLDLDNGGGDKEDQDPARDQDVEDELYEENQSLIDELLQLIDSSVNKVIEKAVHGESICASEASQFETVDSGSDDRRRKKTMLGELSTEVCEIVAGMVELAASPRSPRSSGLTPSRIRGKFGSNNPDDVKVESDQAVKSFVASSSSSSALLDAIAMKKRPSSAQLPAKDNSLLNPQQDTGWVKMTVGGKTLHFETASSLSYGGSSSSSGGDGHNQSHSSAKRRNAVPMALADEGPDDADLRRSSSAIVQHARVKARPSSSPSYLSSKKSGGGTHEDLTNGHKTQMWAPTRGQCALCERRYMRHHLAGVVVMKRIFDLRRKWGMVIQDSKKFCAASALYAKAQVCLLCQEILLHEDERSLRAFESEQQHLKGTFCDTTCDLQGPPPLDEVGLMIHNSILHKWHQQPPLDDGHLLEDVALNKRARQSSTIFDMDARNALQSDAVRCAHTKEELQPWWEVDLANYYVIHSVKIWLREEISHLYNGSGGGIAGSNGNTALSSSTDRSGAQRKTLLRPMMHPPLRHLDIFPLHISISMKTGVGRDLDDIIASCVSSHCVEEKAMPPIVWHAPPNSRDRFVRIQAENQAILHIERVHVYVASTTQKQQKLHETKVRKATLRQQLKRAAFRASIVVNPASKSADLTASAPELSRTGDRCTTTLKPVGGNQTASIPRSSTAVAAAQVHPHSLVSAFFEPEQAEKKRMSRLYSRFKSLLDARSKYLMDELDQERHRQSEGN